MLLKNISDFGKVGVDRNGTTWYNVFVGRGYIICSNRVSVWPWKEMP